MKTSRFSSFSSCLLVGSLSLAIVASALAAGSRKNPTSKLFVAETKGQAQIDTGEKIEALSVKNAYSAEGTTIETKADSSNTLVFSNGSSIIVGPNSRFEIKKFVQEPFTPNRNDLDVEPSISQTVVKVVQGSVGLCTSRLVAGSSMTYQTPHGSINVRGRKVMVEVGDDQTTVSLLEGDVTVTSADGTSTQTLKPGQQAILRQAGPAINVQAIPSEANTKADDQVALACIARRTVFFESVDGSEIQPVPVQPAELPTQFTISRDKLNP
jgi:hypothetical protein